VVAPVLAGNEEFKEIENHHKLLNLMDEKQPGRSRHVEVGRGKRN
jgi:hypothetical protein